MSLLAHTQAASSVALLSLLRPEREARREVDFVRSELFAARAKCETLAAAAAAAAETAAAKAVAVEATEKAAAAVKAKAVTATAAEVAGGSAATSGAESVAHACDATACVDSAAIGRASVADGRTPTSRQSSRGTARPETGSSSHFLEIGEIEEEIAEEIEPQTDVATLSTDEANAVLNTARAKAKSAAAAAAAATERLHKAEEKIADLTAELAAARDQIARSREITTVSAGSQLDASLTNSPFGLDGAGDASKFLWTRSAGSSAAPHTLATAGSEDFSRACSVPPTP
eukprot:3046485-Pleurochrysis_carterae.AAC.2